MAVVAALASTTTTTMVPTSKNVMIITSNQRRTPSPYAAVRGRPPRSSGLYGAFEDLVELPAVDAQQFGLSHLGEHQWAALAARLAATTLLLRVDTGQLGGLHTRLSSLASFS